MGPDAVRFPLTRVIALGTDRPEVQAAAAEARVIFDRVGAKAYLARLDVALAASASSTAGRVTADRAGVAATS